MERSPQKPSFTRNVLHGNAANRKGVSADFSRSAKYRHEKARIRSAPGTASSTTDSMKRKFGDTIVRAPPPKKEVRLSNDLRFTIPVISRNFNIFNQTVVRSFYTWHDVMLELKTHQQVTAFHVDEDHEILMIEG